MERYSLFIALTLCGWMKSPAYTAPVSDYTAQYAESRLFSKPLVEKFYTLKQSQPFWFGTESQALREGFVKVLDSCIFLGLKKEPYHYKDLLPLVTTPVNQEDTTALWQAEHLYTDAAIQFLLDLYSGKDMEKVLRYDDVSEAYRSRDEDHILEKLAGIKNTDELNRLVNSLEPSTEEYRLLKDELRNKQLAGDAANARLLAASLNYLRWLHHFNFDKMVVINAATAQGRYFENNNLLLKMKVIVGKPATKTPLFAAHCNQIILYPYWNVPNSIATKELLPKFRANPSLIDATNFEVLNEKGRVVNHHKLNWSAFTADNFPYKFRQSTGCDNALGVIKFDLTNPFTVYMHDTNSKKLFNKDSRHYSHGCIRLQEPLKLANYLTNNKVSSSYVEACYKNQQPEYIKLEKPVPVFIIYAPAEADDKGTIVYHKDIYGHFR